jgi:hypothetical protein
MADPVPVRFDRQAIHVEAPAGGEIVLRGSLYSSHDGARIDATTTTWPSSTPGGASVDPGGLFDLAAGGFHVVSRDPATHEVHAVATGGDAPLCALSHELAPCLPLRLNVQARSRLLETRDWQASLSGAITVELLNAPVYAPAISWTAQAGPTLKAGAAWLALALLAASCAAFYRHWSSTPTARLSALARRVQKKAARIAPLVAAPLAPALDSTLLAVRSRRVDARSAFGQRIATVLNKLETTLDQTEQAERATREQEVVEELSREVAIALQAASEAAQIR